MAADRGYRIDFLKHRKLFMALSGSLVLIAIISLLLHQPPLNPGLDFTGGTRLRVQFPEDVSAAEVRSALGRIAIPGVDLTASLVQDFPDLRRQGQFVKTITLMATEEDDVDRVIKALGEQFPGIEVLERDVVSGQVSREIRQKAWQAILVALVVMLIYISWRFKLRFAVGAVVALVHDVIIPIGVFSLFRFEVNLSVIAALLTIVGYSVNDTIIVFDRVRENLGTRKRKVDYYDVLNLSNNQTLPRTIQTSVTTLIPVLIALFFGGSVLRPFCLAMTIGLISGTYSSIYIAEILVYYWSLKADAARGRARVRAR
ncbi:MAG: protein translocase subunit SecF [Candidatus Acetothermia bacterium]|nr:protein translocase subunit SecF [Candidatus Acetothermia bacterium]MDH7505289.1 protein translocase subunit SecF [Candidatus Acetothermia bacterium]